MRWRFGSVASATVNGTPATVEGGADGPSVTFDHAATSLVAWREGVPPTPVVEPAAAPAAVVAPAPTPTKKTTHRRSRRRKKR